MTFRIKTLSFEFAFIKTLTSFLILFYIFYNFIITRIHFFSFDREFTGFIAGDIFLAILLVYFFRPFYRGFPKDLLIGSKLFDILCVLLLLGFSGISYSFTNLLELYSSEIIRINSPAEILNNTNNGYFSIDNYKLNKNIFVSYSDISYSRRRTKMYLTDYFVIPITDRNSARNNFQVWIGLKYVQTINNSIWSSRNVEDKIRTAHNANMDELALFNFKNVKFFNNVKYSGDAQYFLKAIESKSSYTNDNVTNIILVPSLVDLHEERANAVIFVLISIAATIIIFIITKYFLRRNTVPAE